MDPNATKRHETNGPLLRINGSSTHLIKKQAGQCIIGFYICGRDSDGVPIHARQAKGDIYKTINSYRSRLYYTETRRPQPV